MTSLRASGMVPPSSDDKEREQMDIEAAQGMLAWPHSGFHVHDAVWAAADDKEFTVPKP